MVLGYTCVGGSFCQFNCSCSCWLWLLSERSHYDAGKHHQTSTWTSDVSHLLLCTEQTSAQIAVVAYSTCCLSFVIQLVLQLNPEIAWNCGKDLKAKFTIVWACHHDGCLSAWCGAIKAWLVIYSYLLFPTWPSFKSYPALYGPETHSPDEWKRYSVFSQ